MPPGGARRGRAAGAELVPCDHLVEDLRAVKDADEADLIRRGAQLCDAIYAWLAEDGLAGREEREVAWAIRPTPWLRAEGVVHRLVIAA